MAKNPLITDDVKRVIAKIYLEHPDWRAKEIRDGVLARLHEQNPRSKLGWPGLSAVQKELTKQRKTNKARPHESNSLDEPWSLTTIKEYPIPPEALPLVLAVAHHKAFSPKQKLTIREAKWIGRLYALTTEGDRNDNIIAINATLERWAEEYALEERLTELSGTQTTSSKAESLEGWVFNTSKVIQKVFDTHMKEAQNER